MAKSKQPKVRVQPQQRGKQPRGGNKVNKFVHATVSWKIGSMDFDGPWGWNNISSDYFWERIHQHLRSFETMTWDEIFRRRDRHHPILIEKLNKMAQKRLIEIQQDDVEELISLACTGPERIFGIRDNNFLKILWWDPKHEVYPYKKKHT